MKTYKSIQRIFHKPALLAVGLTAIFGLVACGEKEHAHDDEEKGGHKHDKKEEVGAKKEKGDKHEGHDHDKIIAGPNGGRVITSLEPHAEFFVTEGRKVQIAFVDDDLKPVSVGDQKVTVVAGERSAPTNLKFAKSGDVLVSDVVLPEGNGFPVILNIKYGTEGASIREKFNLDLSDCPTCDYKEYACVCDHDEE